MFRDEFELRPPLPNPQPPPRASNGAPRRQRARAALDKKLSQEANTDDTDQTSDNNLIILSLTAS